MIPVQPVILAGGAGSRLWPLSRTGFPKQFLALTGTESLFQQAACRLAALETADFAMGDLLVVCSEAHRFLVWEQLREINHSATLVLEPVARNTAPALTLAALAAQSDGEDPVLLVTPADQAVADQAAFCHALELAIREAANGTIVILGVTPDSPSSGFGYIQTVEAHAPTTQALPVRRFVEKPGAATAQRYLKEGGYYWNAGIFVLKASVWLQALGVFRPDILEATRAAWAQRTLDAAFVRLAPERWGAVPSESVDCAVLEKCPGSRFGIKMVPLDARWSDLGSWDAIWQTLAKDEHGNASVGDVLRRNCRGTLVHASHRLVATIGVEALVIVETADAVLVADRSCSQEVREIVRQLEVQKRPEHLLHRKVHRPWGWYDCIDEGERFKVKRIQVKPKASLSLQKHHHRAEHWVVVMGTAEITCGDKKILLTENQSTYIPLGEVHRLSNPGNIPLEIIEVQSGSYLGEDDIVRFEDHYGRSDA